MEGGCLGGSGVIIGALLTFAQPQVCTALGGRWVTGYESCKNEIGGNGNNDPGSNPFGFADPVRGDG